MKETFELIVWRLTGWRQLSKLLHGLYGYNDALTPVGMEKAEILARQEQRLMPIGRKKHWIEWIFRI